MKNIETIEIEQHAVGKLFFNMLPVSKERFAELFPEHTPAQTYVEVGSTTGTNIRHSAAFNMELDSIRAIDATSTAMAGTLRPKEPVTIVNYVESAITISRTTPMDYNKQILIQEVLAVAERLGVMAGVANRCWFDQTYDIVVSIPLHTANLLEIANHDTLGVDGLSVAIALPCVDDESICVSLQYPSDQAHNNPISTLGTLVITTEASYSDNAYRLVVEYEHVIREPNLGCISVKVVQ